MPEAQAAAAKLAVLASYERQLRDRNSQMEVPGMDFRPIFKMVEQAEQRHAAQQAAKVTNSLSCQCCKICCRSCPVGALCCPVLVDCSLGRVGTSASCCV